MDLVYNNYLRGYGNGTTWRVEIDPPSRPVKSYYEETCIAAEMVWSRKQGNLNVLYSGGMDSEYVINVFLSMGMRVTPVIMKLGPDYNYHDFNNAIKFCRERDISFTVVDLDFEKFVETQLLEILERNQSGRYQMAATMWLASQVDGTVITGNDPPLLVQRKPWKQHPHGIFLEELEVIHSQFNCWKNDGIYGTPFFLSYTPEMMLAILKEQTYVDFATGRHNHATTDAVKINVFNNQNKFAMEPRTKYTGYETIERSNIFAHSNIQDTVKKLLKWRGITYFKYDALVDRLTSGISQV